MTKNTVRSELVLRLTDRQIEEIKRRIQERKAAAAAAVTIREVGVVELGDLGDDSGSILEPTRKNKVE